MRIDSSQGVSRRVASYISPRLDLRLVGDLPGPFPRNQIPSAIAQHLQFNARGDYFPVLHFDGNFA